MDYVDRIEALLPEVRAGLAAKTAKSPLASDWTDFDRPHERPKRRPGSAQSEFLANRAMGDWAERGLGDALASTVPEWRVLQYGNADRIIAGDPEFPAFFVNYHLELAEYGKRPDLLLAQTARVGSDIPNDVAAFPIDTLENIVSASFAGIEVRSSKYFALEYAARANQRPRGSRSVQSFTPKVEDLRQVVRWIKRYAVRHYYAQVFFDVVYLISTERILELLAGGQFTIERNKRNQGKPTIHIPVSEGIELGRFEHPPVFSAETRRTPDGRLDAYVVPTGGKLDLEPKILYQAFDPA